MVSMLVSEAFVNSTLMLLEHFWVIFEKIENIYLGYAIDWIKKTKSDTAVFKGRKFKNIIQVKS